MSCDVCNKERPCVSGPINTSVCSDTYACHVCRSVDDCDECEDTCSTCRFCTHDDDWWCDKNVSQAGRTPGLVSAGFGCLYHQPGRREQG